MMKTLFSLTGLLTTSMLLFVNAAQAESSNSIFVAENRSTLLTLAEPAAEVTVANPDIADVHVHNPTHITIVAKSHGRTVIRVLGKDRAMLRELDITVGYDLPAIRKALKSFLPEENIGVEMVNNSVALTGKVASVTSVDTALRIARQFVTGASNSGPSQQSTASQLAAAVPSAGGAAPASTAPASAASGNSSSQTGDILNLMQVASGQQVMLRVRVGEIQRTALKELGIDLNALTHGAGASTIGFGTGSGIAPLIVNSTGITPINPGSFALPGGLTPTNTQGILSAVYQPKGLNGNSYGAIIKALEEDGLFKVLAEPNLVAVSGEQAEFLSGGEIPIPVVQPSSGASSSISVDYKPFGVAVKFAPIVLSENRIRMSVQPEVSEVSNSNSLLISGFKVPSIETRRAKTTVELAPGESFMIAGLISDQTRATIDQLPGAKDLPILGALFRSTEFQRNETELVISVTPYLVDPLKSADVKLPSDDFRPASQGEMFFYGALGSLSSKPQGQAQPQALEGPTGFMMD